MFHKIKGVAQKWLWGEVGERAQQILAGFRWSAGASDGSNSCLTHPLNPDPWFAETDDLVWTALVVYIFFILNIL